MIRHVVLFKFKPEVDQATRESFIAQLRRLKENVDFVRSVSVGVNFATAPRACDVALIVELEDRAALAAYNDHPKHVPVKQLAGQLCDQLPLVDYETLY